MNKSGAVDTTLLRHGGKWWMFVNIAENEALPRATNCSSSSPTIR
jgi:hypothetical protein